MKQFGYAQQTRNGNSHSQTVRTVVKDTRRMVAAEPDDMEMRGDFTITITAQNASLDAIASAYLDARILKKVADLGDMLCPHSDSWLRPIGLDDLGDVMLQMYRGERKCDAAPVREMAHFDPANFTKAGEVAMRSIGWMRDVAIAIRSYRSALIAEDGSSTAAWDNVHSTVYGREQRA